jgi:hypothetical protein
MRKPGAFIRGDAALSLAIFKDRRHRRLIPKLQAEGWPIVEVAGKRMARDSDLAAEIKARFGRKGALKTSPPWR